MKMMRNSMLMAALAVVGCMSFGAAVIEQYDDRVTPVLKASGAITKGLLYGISGGVATLATNAAGGNVPALGFAITSLTAAQATAGKRVGLASRGILTLSATEITGSTFTAGAPVYVATAGKYTSTRPTTATEMIQPVGIAITTTQILVMVSPAALKAQAAATTVITGF